MDKAYGDVTDQMVADREFYLQSIVHRAFKPWLADVELAGVEQGELAREQLYYVRQAVLQCLHVPGEFWECGVRSAESAKMIAEMLATAAGTGERRTFRFFKGLAPMPDARLAFVHCNLEQYRSTKECLNHCYARLEKNGMIVVQGYGVPSSSGVRAAVDEFFSDKREEPLALSTGPVIVVKL